ncbi:MAG: TonB family protein [Chlorobiaceae bacterium]
MTMSRFFRKDFLDTASLRRLYYGNLVLRRRLPLFLSFGVMTAIALLLFFWLVTTHLDFLVSQGRLSGKSTIGDSYEIVTTMISLAPPPPPSAYEPVATSFLTPTPVIPASVGKVVKVSSQEESTHEQSAATQTELKKATQNQERGAENGRGASSSGIDGSGGDGATVGSYERMPAFLEQKKPAYPETARIAGITGKIFIKVLIGEDGYPLKALIVKRLPEGCTVFDSTVLKSVMESKYYPAIQNGYAVRAWCIIPISFKLN